MEYWLKKEEDHSIRFNFYQNNRTFECISEGFDFSATIPKNGLMAFLQYTKDNSDKDTFELPYMGYDIGTEHGGTLWCKQALKGMHEQLDIEDNADAFIVFLNSLITIKGHYYFDFYGTNPFWVFHDYCHARSDVYVLEISGVSASLEMMRWEEGLTHMTTMGYEPEFDDDELTTMIDNFCRRFLSHIGADQFFYRNRFWRNFEKFIIQYGEDDY